MRVLIVPAFLGGQGGFENYVEEVARLGVENGHEITILTPWRVPTNSTARAVEREGVRFDSAQEEWRRRPDGAALTLLARLRFFAARRRRPNPIEEPEVGRSPARRWVAGYWQRAGRSRLSCTDVVHLFGKPSLFVQQALAVCPPEHRPIYSEIAQVDASYVAGGDRIGMVDVASRCATMTALSRNQHADLARHYRFEGPIRTLTPLLGRAEEVALTELQPPELSSPELVLGSISRLGPEKDLANLVRGFSLARNQIPGLRLRIAGEGPERSTIERTISAEGLHGEVEMVGRVADKADFFGSVDALIVNSLVEGGPITVLEAMAAARPLVTTPVGATPSWLQLGKDRPLAWATRPGRPETLARAIADLARDPSAARQRSVRSRQRFLADLSRAAVGRELLELWRSHRRAS